MSPTLRSASARVTSTRATSSRSKTLEASRSKPGKIAKVPTKICVSSKSHKAHRPFKLLADGLLDLANVPHKLEATVQSNLVNCPLFRLPVELRDQIWRYAAEDTEVYVTFRKEPTSKGRNRSLEVVKGEIHRNGRPTPIDQSIFHLPLVSRSLYAETATLAYARSLFTFPSDCYQEICQFSDQLSPAQRNSIGFVQPGAGTFEIYYSGRFKNYYGCRFRSLFPGLKWLMVSEKSMAHVINMNEVHMDRILKVSEWQEWILTKAREKDGEQLKVEFIPKPSDPVGFT